MIIVRLMPGDKQMVIHRCCFDWHWEVNDHSVILIDIGKWIIIG